MVALPSPSDSALTDTASLAVPVVAADPGPGSGATSPVEALRRDELDRSRIFFRVVLAMTAGGIVAALVSRGDPTARAVVIATSLGSALAAAYVLARVLTPERYQFRRLIGPGIPVLIGAFAGVYYWGPVSPVTGMLVYGIYFFSLGRETGFITANYVLIAIVHAVLFFIPGPGLVGMRSTEAIDRGVMLGIIEGLYLTAFVTARLSYRVTLRAVSQLEQAIRAVSHRDALLAEHRAELDRVREIGGPGRFSELVVGAYRLGMVIGRGAIGEVYEARVIATGRPAAVKLLRADALGDEVQARRLVREAEVAARIASPNVVGILDVGTTASGTPYIAMERMHGWDLAHELRSRRRLGLAEARAVIDDVAAGLEAARALGIVHRDLKPHNVFGALDDRSVRTWKIVDFGLSKLGTGGTLTAGQVVGTPCYMAPEQARGEEVDHRADVYSLAAILYRTITGYNPFDRGDIATTLYAVVNDAPPRPSSLARIPADVERVLAVGLAKSPGDRFATAAELVRWYSDAIGAGLPEPARVRADALPRPWSEVMA